MEPMQSLDDGEMTRAYTTLYARLEAVGIKPKINIMNNEAFRAIWTWLTKENTAYQTVALGDGSHQNNRAKRAIQTGSNHIISTIATTDPDFPSYWCYGIEQMEMTMNMLRKTHVNPKISAFTYLHGQFAYNTVPVIPFEWKIVCFKDPADRQKTAFHGVEGFVIGMCTHGHQKIQAIIPSTNAVRETNTFAIFAPPQYVMPTVPTPGEVLLEASANLSTAVQSIGLNTTYAQERERMKDVLQRLQDIIKNKTDMVGGAITEPTW